MRLKLTDVLTTAPAPPPAGRGSTNTAIVAALRDAGRPMAPLEILGRTGLEYRALRKQLSRLARRGDIMRLAQGQYIAGR